MKLIKNNLSKIMGEKRMKITELSKVSGISRTTLTNIYYDRAGGIKFDTINKICKSLGCKIEDIFVFYDD